MGIKEGNFKKIIIAALLTMPMLLASTHQHGNNKFSQLENVDIIGTADAVRLIEQQKLVTLNEIASLEYEVVNAHKIVHLIDGNETASHEEVEALMQEIATLNEERENAIAQYQVILLEEYKNRDYKSKLYFLASSSSLSVLVNRLSHLNKLKQLREKQLRIVESKRLEVANKLAVYKGSTADKTELSEQKILELQTLNDELRRKHLKMKELEEEGNKLRLKLQQNSRSKSFQQDQTIAPLLADKQANKLINRLVWPIKTGIIVERFGVHKHSVERKVQVENNGIDILVADNSEVFAVAPGKVKAIIDVPGLNQSIIIDHGGFHSVYSNITNAKVQVGDPITEGKPMGFVSKDEMGVSKLHFELWEGIHKRNPEEYLKERL